MKRTIDNLMEEKRLTASITGSGRKILFIFFLFILLFLLAAISVAVGPLSITVTEVYNPLQNVTIQQAFVGFLYP